MHLLIMFAAFVVDASEARHFYPYATSPSYLQRDVTTPQPFFQDVNDVTVVDQRTGIHYNPYSKHHPGRHVCTNQRNVTHPVRTKHVFCKPTYKKYMVRCGTQWCEGVRLVYEKYHKEHVSDANHTHLDYLCCPGWTQVNYRSHGCNKPVCVTPCLNGGKCIKPNVCSCPPGYDGTYCETKTSLYTSTANGTCPLPPPPTCGNSQAPCSSCCPFSAQVSYCPNKCTATSPGFCCPRPAPLAICCPCLSPVCSCSTKCTAPGLFPECGCACPPSLCCFNCKCPCPLPGCCCNPQCSFSCCNPRICTYCPNPANFNNCPSSCLVACMNGGTCDPPFRCFCTPGFGGARCETNLMQNQCLVPCVNGGTCKPPSSCLCPPGFTGSKCEFDVNECNTLKPCDQICYNTPGSYKCECKENFLLQRDGQTCRKEYDEGTTLEAKDLEGRRIDGLDKRLLKLEQLVKQKRSNEVSKNDLTTIYGNIDKISNDISIIANKLQRLESGSLNGRTRSTSVDRQSTNNKRKSLTFASEKEKNVTHCGPTCQFQIRE